MELKLDFCFLTSLMKGCACLNIGRYMKSIKCEFYYQWTGKCLMERSIWLISYVDNYFITALQEQDHFKNTLNFLYCG